MYSPSNSNYCKKQTKNNETVPTRHVSTSNSNSLPTQHSNLLSNTHSHTSAIYLFLPRLFSSVFIRVEKLKILLKTCICIINCDPAGFLLVDYESRGSAGASDFGLKEELSDYYLNILHKCGRVSLPSFSSLKVGMTRRIKKTGIRHEKNIFLKLRKMSA